MPMKGLHDLGMLGVLGSGYTIPLIRSIKELSSLKNPFLPHMIMTVYLKQCDTPSRGPGILEMRMICVQLFSRTYRACVWKVFQYVRDNSEKKRNFCSYISSDVLMTTKHPNSCYILHVWIVIPSSPNRFRVRIRMNGWNWRSNHLNGVLFPRRHCQLPQRIFVKCCIFQCKERKSCLKQIFLTLILFSTSESTWTKCEVCPVLVKLLTFSSGLVRRGNINLRYCVQERTGLRRTKQWAGVFDKKVTHRRTNYTVRFQVTF